jgi:hypothetical protein
MPATDSHNYANINKTKIDLMFSELVKSGAKIAGNNPWQIDTNRHGVHLTAEWNESASMLDVSVTCSNWYVPREKVWSSLDEIISHVQKLETA